MAIDLPGVGLSDPIDLPRKRYRETAVAWLDSLLDALELDAAALLGHSGGGRWALWSDSGGRPGSAELYWVARNMVEAAVGASSTLPDLLCDWSGEASVIVRCVIRH